jgi:hypothetical protein
VLLQGFFRELLPVCGTFVSTGIGSVPAGLGRTSMTGDSCVWCTPGGWARSRQSGRALRLVLNAPSPSLRGTEGEVSTTPIDRVANCEFLVELLVGGSSGRPCPVR